MAPVQQRKGRGGAEFGIRVSDKPQQWHTLSLLSSLVLCVNSNPSRRILVIKMRFHVEKLKDAREHWLLLLFSDCMIWDWKCLGLQAWVLNRVGNQSKIICVESLNAEGEKKFPCFLKQASSLNSELFPSNLKFSAFGLKALSIMMGYSREYLERKKYLSSGIWYI